MRKKLKYYKCGSCSCVCREDKCMGFCPECGRGSLDEIEDKK